MKLERAGLRKSKWQMIFNGTVIGIIALWVIWVSTSVLIHFAR